MKLNELTLHEVRRGLDRGDFSSVEVTEACLKVAEARRDETNAYVEITREMALEQARAADRRLAARQLISTLDGVPLAIKDNILVAGVRATAGSSILKDYRAPHDATVIGRLRRAGAVFLGKTNLDEFAMGSSTETSCHGPTRNPRDPSRVPGGSSGGSAAAVAENSAIAALGSDTGGSIRQPAAFCGVVGLKPTYGRVSRSGLIAMASSLDQIGPIAKTVADVALLLGAIEGSDSLDSTTVPLKPEQATVVPRPGSLKGMKLGLPREYFVSGMDAGVEASVRQAAAELEKLGASVREVSLPHAKYALAVYYVLMPCEVSANLARFDGMRYGSRVTGENLDATYRLSRGQGFGPEVRRRILLGTYALSAGYYDAYYLKALKVRRLIVEDFRRAFSEVDLLVTPTTPGPAWLIGEKLDDPLQMYLADIFTVPVNVAGLPAVSLPCGLSEGLPVGLQLIGRPFDEAGILRAAAAYEQAAGARWASRQLPTDDI